MGLLSLSINDPTAKFLNSMFANSSSGVAGLAWARGLVTGGSPSSGRLEVADTLEVSLEAGTLQPGHPLFRL